MPGRYYLPGFKLSSPQEQINKINFSSSILNTQTRINFERCLHLTDPKPESPHHLHSRILIRDKLQVLISLKSNVVKFIEYNDAFGTVLSYKGWNQQ